MTVYSLLLFGVTYRFIHTSFAYYQGYILLGFTGVCVIAGVLLAVATVPWMQTACNLLANHLRAKHPSWEEKLTGAGHKLAQLQAESRSLLQDPILLLHLFLCNVLKFTTWYIIPWIVFCNSLRGESGDLPFSFLQCFALTSLSQSLAGVIPTPAGIGSIKPSSHCCSGVSCRRPKSCLPCFSTGSPPCCYPVPLAPFSYWVRGLSPYTGKRERQTNILS